MAGWIVWKGHVGDNFHPTSRYPASHAINASSTTTTIGKYGRPGRSGRLRMPGEVAG